MDVKHLAGDSDLVASGNLFMETEQGTSVFLLVKVSVTDQREITQGLERFKPWSPSA